MVSLLPVGRQDAEPPLWTRPHELLGAIQGRARDVLCEGPLGAAVEPLRMLDRKAIFVCEESEMHVRAPYVLDWLRDVMGLQMCEGWGKSAPAYMRDLVQALYSPAGNSIAFALVECSRLQIRKVLGSAYREMPSQCRKPVFQRPGRRLGLPDGIKLPGKPWRFAAPAERRLAALSTAVVPIQRTFAVGKASLYGWWTCWCAATAGEDEDKLSQALVPAGLRCLQANGVNAARLVTWGKLDVRSGAVRSYSVDLDPITGDVLSLRHADAPLRLHVTITPQWDWLLRLAMRG